MLAKIFSYYLKLQKNEYGTSATPHNFFRE